ncbi:AraC family transcriptional regulator [uncultured Tenacibaculum sp.]|uniref:helix-turn-helix domain-containing protein n=1 Tax=uncultured Tenacibaculum sp. TaxID=174713 RepID=UPI00262C23DD|nr:helix-turn-helix domain-containing protein [uncultured Tenacibaculum sp.]
MQTILNQLVYFGFFQSLLIISIYFISLKKRTYINSFMLILIAVLSVGFLGKVLHSGGFFNKNFRLIAMSEFSALLFGPTIFLFVRSVLHKQKFVKKDVVHYVPGFLYSLFILGYFILPSRETQLARNKVVPLMHVIYICHAVGLIVNIWYWYLGFKVFRSFSEVYRKEISYVPHTKFLKNFLVITGLCLLVWLILFLTSFLGFPMLERNSRPYIWLILTFIVLFITYYLMMNPEVLKSIPELKEKKYQQSKLDVQDLERLKVDLEQLMLEKKPYLNNKLLKKELAEMLGVHSPELSRLLNESIGMNFFEYVNYYRIKEFVQLAESEKGKQLTFFGLAQEAGFNSKTTFNKSFKNLMGVSPSAYFNKNQ